MEGLNREIYSCLYPNIEFERIRLLKNAVIEKKDLIFDYKYYFEDTVELQNRAIQYGIQFNAFVREFDLNREEVEFIKSFYPDLTVVDCYSYFYEAIEFLGTDTQVAFYKNLVLSSQIIGSYSQAELGNGGNLNGIETQAIFDKGKDEFIINSPTITSSKFWIGGVGINSNFTVLIAKLIIEGKDYGPHAFITQIRNLRSHKVFNGAFIGEIGAKMGLSSSDQGFTRYEFLSLPKTSLLNRYSTIDKSGIYSTRFDPIQILTMSNLIVRVKTLTKFWAFLGPSLQISLSYSTFRKQFTDPEDVNQETRLIDYQIQQAKLFPGLSRLILFTFSVNFVKDLLQTSISSYKRGNDSYFNDLFCVVSLFKAGITERTTTDIELCRRACGGHGYMKLAGISTYYTNYVSACTYAGDNTVITIESIKIIIKTKPRRFYRDLANSHENNLEQTWLINLARGGLRKIENKFNELINKGLDEKETWNLLQVESIKIAEILFLCLVHQQMLRYISMSKFKEDLEAFRNVFLFDEIKKFEGDLRANGVKDEGWDNVKDRALQGMAWIKENYVQLINAFEFPDEVLNSVLSKPDPYKEMIWTSKNLNPINKMKKDLVLKYLRPKI